MRLFPDKTQDQEFQDLGGLGHKGSLNDRQFKYLRGEGFTSSLSDMFKQFFEGDPVTPPDPVINPEDGLTVTVTYAPQDTIPNMSSQATLPIVMAADFTGLDGVTTPGIIFEAGGGGVGALAGFYPDGRFMFRGGSGSTEWNDTTMTYNIVPSGIIHGDGTLVMELDITTEAITIWWNGVEVGTPAGALSGGWVGTDVGAYLNGKEGSTVSTTVPSAIPAYTTASDLRVYSNQLATR